MPLPDPKPGLVINYNYLWRDDVEAGREEGRKDRPCVVILAVQNVEGSQIVTVAPVTHSEPSRPDVAVEMPGPVKKHLGLDDLKSWIVTTEVNRFTWPGSDLRPISRGRQGVFAYGFVPADLVRKIRQQIAQRQSVDITRRDG